MHYDNQKSPFSVITKNISTKWYLAAILVAFLVTSKSPGITKMTQRY